MSPPPVSSGLVVFGYVPRMPCAALRGSEDILFCGCAGSSSLNLRFAASARTRPVPGSTAASSSAFLLLSEMRWETRLRASAWASLSIEVTTR